MWWVRLHVGQKFPEALLEQVRAKGRLSLTADTFSWDQFRTDYFPELYFQTW